MFCLGAVLTFAATGVGPFGDASLHALYYRTVYEEPDLSGLPPALRGVVADCLAKDGERRPTVGELTDRFANAVSGGDAGGDLAGGGWLPQPVKDALRLRGTAAPTNGRAAPAAAVPPARGPEPDTSAGAGARTGLVVRPEPEPVRAPEPVTSSTSPKPGDRQGDGGLTRRRLLSGAIGVTATAGIGLAAWKMNDGGGGGTHQDGEELSVKAKPPGTELWRADVGDSNGNAYHYALKSAAPAGMVYFADDTYVYAVTAYRGTRKWRRKMGGAKAVLGAAEGLLVVNTEDSLIAFDASDGDEKWRREYADWGNEDLIPTMQGAYLFLADPRSLHALDIQSGEHGWKQDFSTDNELSDLVVAGRTAYISSAETLDAADAKTGDRYWKYPMGARLSRSPLAAGAAVYLVVDDALHAVDRKSGERLWKYPIGVTGQVTALSVADGVVYVGNQGTVHAVGTDGKKIWQKTVDEDSFEVNVAGWTLYLQFPSGALALDARTGKKKWDHSLNEKRPITSLIPVLGAALVGNGDTVYALSSETGDVQWDVATRGDVTDPVVGNGVAYFGGGGRIYGVTV